MKVPLRYQMTEYDRGPTSPLNALSLLFEREEIPPEVVRNIMLFCLDSYGADGFSGKNCVGMALFQRRGGSGVAVADFDVGADCFAVRDSRDAHKIQASAQNFPAIQGLFVPEYNFVCLRVNAFHISGTPEGQSKPFSLSHRIREA